MLVPNDRARGKEVILRGDEIDLTTFPFMQVNPGDGGRYINTASVFTVDPKAGVNLGTYRCQLKGPRKVAVSPGAGQTGWKMLDAARRRGEKVARISLVLGQDPVVSVVSGSRTANRVGDKPVDELAVAGGLPGLALGEPLDLDAAGRRGGPGLLREEGEGEEEEGEVAQAA